MQEQVRANVLPHPVISKRMAHAVMVEGRIAMERKLGQPMVALHPVISKPYLQGLEDMRDKLVTERKLGQHMAVLHLATLRPYL